MAVVTFAGDVHVRAGLHDRRRGHRPVRCRRCGPQRAARGSSTPRPARVELIRAAKMPSGSAVILSDGADHRSQTPADEVAAAANSANARVYTVGLRVARQRLRDPEPAGGRDARRVQRRHLAERTWRGSTSVSAPGSRTSTCSATARRPAPTSRVRVAVRITGLRGVAGPATRRPRSHARTAPPFTHSPAETLWLSPGAALAIALVVAVLLVLGAVGAPAAADRVAAAACRLLRRRGGCRRRTSPVARRC